MYSELKGLIKKSIGRQEYIDVNKGVFSFMSSTIVRYVFNGNFSSFPSPNMQCVHVTGFDIPVVLTRTLNIVSRVVEKVRWRHATNRVITCINKVRQRKSERMESTRGLRNQELVRFSHKF